MKQAGIYSVYTMHYALKSKLENHRTIHTSIMAHIIQATALTGFRTSWTQNSKRLQLHSYTCHEKQVPRLD